MPSVTCVLYHNIAAETKFEAGLDVSSSMESFKAQIEWLEKNYDVIDLSSLLTGNLPRKPLLITFDDCYLSSFEAARSVLHPRGVPCVFFVNPGLLDPNSISLDSTLAWCANSLGLDRLCAEIGVSATENVGALIMQEMSKRTATERTALRTYLQNKFGLDSLKGRSPIINPIDIADFHKFGIEVGNHTGTHVHCRALNEEELAAEVVTAKFQLETLSGKPVRSFAVPYGHERDLTPKVLQKLRESGHEAIFLVHARSNRFRMAKDIWYRVSLTDQSSGSLPIALKLMPILRSLKHMMSRIVEGKA